MAGVMLPALRGIVQPVIRDVLDPTLGPSSTEGPLDFTGAVELIVQGPGKLIIQNQTMDINDGEPLLMEGGLRLDWGDGSPPVKGAGWEEHTYPEGEFHVRARFEKLPRGLVNFLAIGGEALVGISKWGDQEHLAVPLTLAPQSLTTGNSHPAINFAQVPDHSPPPMLFYDTWLGYDVMYPSLRSFSGSEVFNADISGWDMTKYESLSQLFQSCDQFNQDISSWDMSNIKSMGQMFYEASSFNQDISGWDVSSVTDMNSMFNGASSFDQDLSGWCVTNITGAPANNGFSKNSGLAPEHHPVWGTCPGNE